MDALHTRPTSFPSTMRAPSRCVLLVTILSSLQLHASSADPAYEREVLRALFNETGGSSASWFNSDNWMNSGQSHCDWYGVDCDDDGAVIALGLPFNGLKGTVPETIWRLELLERLDLSTNDVVVTFDEVLVARSLRSLVLSDTQVFDLEGLGKSNTLTDLDVSGTRLNGRSFGEIFSIGSLANLDIGFNRLSGTLPSPKNLINLDYFSCPNSNLQGSLPPGFENLQQLSFLNASNNILSGTIDTGFSKLPNLRNIDLSGNNLSGTLASGFLSGIVDKSLEVNVDLSDNYLIEYLPSQLGSFEVLNIDITGNYIDGFPLEFCGRTDWMRGAVGRFRCDAILCPRETSNSLGRQASGDEPCLPCQSARAFGTKVCADAGSVSPTNVPSPAWRTSFPFPMRPTGSPSPTYTPHHPTPRPVDPDYPYPTASPLYTQFPTPMLDPGFERLVLRRLFEETGGSDGNWANSEGWTDPEVSHCEYYGVACGPNGAVIALSLRFNGLSGTVPQLLYRLTWMERLDLSRNNVVVTFEEIFFAMSLRGLVLSSTLVFDAKGIGMSNSLTGLDLSGTQLTSSGIIDIFNVRSLANLDLGFNQLSGTLPSLRNLLKLSYFSCPHSNLFGTLPPEFGRIRPLSFLNVSGNLLIGTISSELSNLMEISTMDLSKNMLSGMVPNGFLKGVADKSLLMTLLINDNYLTGTLPSELANFDVLNIDATGNQFEGFPPEFCVREDWMRGAVGKFGCDAILCPPRTWNPLGRQVSIAEPCLRCGMSMGYVYGSKTCAGDGGGGGLTPPSSVPFAFPTWYTRPPTAAPYPTYSPYPTPVPSTWPTGVSYPTYSPYPSRVQVLSPARLFRAVGYDHLSALFGLSPPRGQSITLNVSYADSDLCDPNVNVWGGYPSRPTFGNGTLLPWTDPFILMADRGGCTFVAKVRHAQRAGAAAVVIADNMCLCSAGDACRSDDFDMAGECQARAPVMADDGSGRDIVIPSVLLFKQDADMIKAELMANRSVRMELSWPVREENRGVEYELWTTPTDAVGRSFVVSFWELAKALGEPGGARFVPRMYIYDGLGVGCYDDGEGGVEERCGSLCTNRGRYCMVDPDDDLEEGISGAQVVEESLRRMCIWEIYGKADDGAGMPWWEYAIFFDQACSDPGSFSDVECINNVFEVAEIDSFQVDKCMNDSGGAALDADTQNSLLEGAIRMTKARGVVTIPSLFINGIAFGGNLSSSNVFPAICSALDDGQGGGYPRVCRACAACPGSYCVQNGSCPSGGGYGTPSPSWTRRPSPWSCELACFNGGSCAFGSSGTPVCVCPDGYEGDICEKESSPNSTEVSYCPDGSRCLYGGKCAEMSYGNSSGLYYCNCTNAASPDGYPHAGISCEHKATAFCQKAPSRDEVDFAEEEDDVVDIFLVEEERQSLRDNCTGVLTTTFEANIGSFGNAFNLRVPARLSAGLSNPGVVLTGMDLHTDVERPLDFEVYATPGSFNKSLSDLSRWDQIAAGTVTGRGRGAPTPIPASMWFWGRKELAPGSLWGLYVTFTSADMRYTDTTLDVGEVFASGDRGEIQVEVGVGVGEYPLGKTFFRPKAWDGRLHYKILWPSVENVCRYDEPPPPPSKSNNSSWTPAASFCTNEGTCQSSVDPGEGHGGCSCPEDYEGEHCEFLAGSVPPGWPFQDEDKDADGNENETAVPLEATICPAAGMSSVCKEEGSQCLAPNGLVESCASFPNGGVCDCSVGAAPCRCSGGDLVPECPASSGGLVCLNGGLCAEASGDKEKSYFCNCTSATPGGVPHAGATCEHPATSLCNSQPPITSFCTNGGACVSITPNNQTHVGCLCLDGFEGDYCQSEKVHDKDSSILDEEDPADSGDHPRAGHWKLVVFVHLYLFVFII